MKDYSKLSTPMDEDVLRMAADHEARKSAALDKPDPSIVYLAPGDLAKDSGMHRATIQRFIREGKLKAVRYRNKLLIHPDDAEAFIKTQKTPNV